MTVVHFFPYEKFTSHYVNLINTHFRTDEHIFYIYGKENSLYEMNIKDQANVQFVEDIKMALNSDICNKHMRECDKIILHSFWVARDFLEVSSNNIYNKMYVVFWGGDIYTSVFSKLHPIHILRSIRDEFYKKRVLRKIKGAITLVEGDYYIARRKYSIRCKQLDGLYISEGTIGSSNKDKILLKQDEPYYILVGNSATASNRHKEIIRKISHFKDENVKFLFPLSYGDFNYQKKIVLFGKKHLGDAFVPLTDYMSYDSYLELLEKCCIGIFNNNRQQALGNISQLTSFGAKIFLNKKSTMWSEFVDKFNMKFHEIDTLSTLDFPELVELNHAEAEYNISILENLRSLSRFKELWKDIFEDGV